MSLDLDKRHRAMLREMGVRVWLPNAVAPAPDALAHAADVPAALVAPAVSAVSANGSANGSSSGSAPGVGAAAPAEARLRAEAQAREVFGEPTRVAPSATPPPSAARAPAAPAPRPSPPRAAAPSAASAAAPADAAVTWRLGEAVALYTGASQASAGHGARWLVLAETPASALQAAGGGEFQPFHGDAGKLLDNMLRAARLHQSAMVLLAPLTRLAAGTGTGPEVDAALAELVAASQPDVVLVMGRLAAQALLRSDLPFGKIRGQVHRLPQAPGVAVVATYDAPFLLRNAGDKAKAWDDLCLALASAASAAG